MIINTFISDSDIVPAYTALSLKKARDLNPDIPISFICKKKQPYFDKLKINWVDQSLFSDHPIVQNFNELSWFQRHGTPQTTYPSPEGFWHKTCERIFYLAAYASTHNLKTFLHTENDVLMFYDFKTMMQETTGEFCATMMSKEQATFAVMYCPYYDSLVELCEHMLKTMKLGENNIKAKYSLDHVSEMSLLKIAMSDGIIDTFPVVSECDMCFDPGSYGQFLAGTNNGHGPGFKDPKHYTTQYGYEAVMINGLPFAKKNNIKQPLFNLHIHSKKLELFI